MVKKLYTFTENVEAYNFGAKAFLFGKSCIKRKDSKVNPYWIAGWDSEKKKADVLAAIKATPAYRLGYADGYKTAQNDLAQDRGDGDGEEGLCECGAVRASHCDCE